MIERTREFRVSVLELEYLERLLSHEQSLAGALRFQEGTPDRKPTVLLTRAGAEQLREYLTRALAAIGFDEDYSPNENGKMLEDLIDRFHVS